MVDKSVSEIQKTSENPMSLALLVRRPLLRVRLVFALFGFWLRWSSCQPNKHRNLFFDVRVLNRRRKRGCNFLIIPRGHRPAAAPTLCDEKCRSGDALYVEDEDDAARVS